MTKSKNAFLLLSVFSFVTLLMTSSGIQNVKSIGYSTLPIGCFLILAISYRIGPPVEELFFSTIKIQSLLFFVLSIFLYAFFDASKSSLLVGSWISLILSSIDISRNREKLSLLTAGFSIALIAACALFWRDNLVAIQAPIAAFTIIVAYFILIVAGSWAKGRKMGDQH